MVGRSWKSCLGLQDMLHGGSQVNNPEFSLPNKCHQDMHGFDNDSLQGSDVSFVTENISENPSQQYIRTHLEKCIDNLGISIRVPYCEGDLNIQAGIPHKLEVHTFNEPTWCSHCGGFLWGIRNQVCL